MRPVRGKRSRGLGREVRSIWHRGRQVWRLVPAPRRLALGGAVLVMFLTSSASSVVALGLGRMVNAVDTLQKARAPRADLWGAAILYLSVIGAAYLVRESMNVLRRFLVENTCTRIDKDMSVRVVSRLLRRDLGMMAKEQVGALHGRIHRSVEGYVRFLRISFLDFIPAVMTGLVALSVAASQRYEVALVMLGVIPLSLCLTVWQLMSQKGVRVSLLRTREKMDGTVVEQLTGIDYVRAADTHRQEIRRVRKRAEGRRSREVRHHFQMSLFGCGKALNEGVFHLLVVAFAVGLFINGHIPLGDILTFSILFLSVMAPLNEVHRVIDEGHECSLKVADLMEMLREPEDRSFHVAEEIAPRLDLHGVIPLFEAEDLVVEFAGKDGQMRRALDGVSLAIRHGETIGVAGRSGSGKSTWLRVMMRLTHPTSGRAELGGVPLENVSRKAIGEMIGYVGQNPFVFSGTIFDNIAYGEGEPTAAQVENAARMAAIHDEIMAMPGGYSARVAERGQNLSGGQRQRLALARAFLKNPPVLILDEGTSALDNISERRVQKAIAAARADRTVILVAHRLSTLRDADRIFVFEGGRVVETGRYNDLVRRNGAFAELVRSAETAHTPEPAPTPPAPPVEVPAQMIEAAVMA